MSTLRFRYAAEDDTAKILFFHNFSRAGRSVSGGLVCAAGIPNWTTYRVTGETLKKLGTEE